MVMVNLAKIRFPEDVKNINDFYGLWSYAKPILRQDIMSNYMEMTDELKANFKRTNEVEKALDYAIKNESIQVYFQPIYDTKKKCFTSLEALARMFDDKLGFVAPDEFIAQAELNGTIIPLELMILEKTCKFIEKELLPRKNQITIESVHVNVSVQQCMQQNMEEVFLDIIDRHNVPRTMIMLEITERATVTAPELMKKQMLSLMEKGVRFALDDYGTGNANCSYLIEYPFAKAKFDKGMVWAYFESELGKIVLDGEMQTIHKLQIPIVAEGIETKEQLEEMEAMGVEQVQGYYFSKPVPMNDIIDVIEK